jgi:polyhydroxybutyrate depolymerase
VRAATLLVLTIVCSACGAAPTGPSPGPASASPIAVPPAPASEPPTPSPEPSPAIRLDEPVIAVGDDARRIRVIVPEPEPARPAPLLVFLHEFGGSTSEAVRQTGFDRLVPEAGFIAAFPPSDGRGWAASVSEGLSDSDVDEVYLDGMLDQLLATYPVDPDRVYVAGFSIGAVMAGRAACRLSDKVAGVALIAGNAWAGDCDPARPVPILIMHGTADSTYPFAAAESLVDAWRERDGCSGPLTTQELGNQATVATSDICDDGAVVEFVSVTDGWHTWFREPDATRLVWEFFSGTSG